MPSIVDHCEFGVDVEADVPDAAGGGLYVGDGSSWARMNGASKRKVRARIMGANRSAKSGTKDGSGQRPHDGVDIMQLYTRQCKKASRTDNLSAVDQRPRKEERGTITGLSRLEMEVR